MGHWADLYVGYPDIGLTYIYTNNHFFNSFSTKQAKTIDGLCWDSGDPIVFTEKTLEHYRLYRIDPKSKTIVYSNSLNPENIDRIKSYANRRIYDVYEVGAFLTNDVGIKIFNMAIKLSEGKPEDYCYYIPTVKISVVEGKHTGDPEEVELCKKLLKLEKRGDYCILNYRF